MAYKLNADTLLEHSPIFQDLDADHVSRMAKSCRQIRVAKHSFAFRRGERASGLYVVAMGHIKLAIPSVGGHEKVLEFFGPGQVFGESVMFLDEPYMVDAQALEDTLLIWIAKEDIYTIIDEDPSFSLRLLESLARRLLSLTQDIEAVNQQSAAQRLIAFLLSEPRNGNAMRFPFPKSMVASKLGLSPETLSRLLNQLSTAGLISVQGRVVTIHQPDVMRTQQLATAGA